MHMKHILVSAANVDFYPLLAGWIQSIRDQPDSSKVAIGVIDIGLTSEQRSHLDGCIVVDGKWDMDMGDRKDPPRWLQAQTVRPFLREYFPGYQCYVWLDADTWIQCWWAIDWLVGAAETTGLAVVPEVDRSYRAPETELQVDKFMGIPYRVSSYSFRRYKAIYGEQAARELFDKPVINSGVIALRSDVPHWEIWQREFQRALKATTRNGMDQVSLNYVCYACDLEVELLPARCNWVAHRRIPDFDNDSNSFTEPCFPHDEIGIVHLTLRTKNGNHEVRQRNGRVVSISLRYPGLDG